MDKFTYYVFYKPYGVLNQFSKAHPDHITLADYLKVEKDIYPIGRLDKDSEGLLILSNDTSLNEKLLHPNKKHTRTYFVQVDEVITDKAVEKLSKGVQIKLDSGIYNTSPCTVKKLAKAPLLPERYPPIRIRQNIPTSWTLIELTEGKNRQVRKMFASVGFPVLRLVRVQIEDLKLGKLEPGKFIQMSEKDIYTSLHLDVNSTPTATKNKLSEQKDKNNTPKATAKATPKKATYNKRPARSKTTVHRKKK